MVKKLIVLIWMIFSFVWHPKVAPNFLYQFRRRISQIFVLGTGGACNVISLQTLLAMF